MFQVIMPSAVSHYIRKYRVFAHSLLPTKNNFSFLGSTLNSEVANDRVFVYNSSECILGILRSLDFYYIIISSGIDLHMLLS